MDTITVCMGSSCFSKGNSDFVNIISIFLEKYKLTDKVQLKGSLCCGLCKKGPVIDINGKVYNYVSAENINTILLQGLGLEK